jgi:uncharacterized protein
MTRIGLISDTHGFLDEKLFDYFKDCDEIWHAGDIGTIQVALTLSRFKPLRAVYGNIDGQDIRKTYPEILRFFCEDVEVLIKHIGGYPKHYDRTVMEEISAHPPDLFISGHSHILKIINDPKFKLLHVNPGACGKNGFHQVRTAVRFAIDKKKIQDMEVIELGKRV